MRHALLFSECAQDNGRDRSRTPKGRTRSPGARVGTRYCAVNSPYKVRQFNWFDHDLPTPLNEQLNPDVTVRRRAASLQRW